MYIFTWKLINDIAYNGPHWKAILLNKEMQTSLYTLAQITPNGNNYHWYIYLTSESGNALSLETAKLDCNEPLSEYGYIQCSDKMLSFL